MKSRFSSLSGGQSSIVTDETHAKSGVELNKTTRESFPILNSVHPELTEDKEKPTAVCAKKAHEGGIDPVSRVNSGWTLNINYKNRIEVQRPSWDVYFIEIAKAVSKRSLDGETQVGVVIIDTNRRILATGYNGFPPGCDDQSLPNLRPDKYPFMVHAEINAIASSRQDLRGATLYCLWSPCRDCAKAIITAGIRRVVFERAYRNEDFDFVHNLLTQCGIETTQIER